MENYPYTSSYPDSHDSSPRSESWDDQQQQQQPSSNYKVKFMCSYGGKILPRPHDNQLSYVGGDTKILSVDRTIKFSNIISKLSSLCSDSDICFKYQLPGEDLDALISVTNDEDLEHMMLEYDRLSRSTSTGTGTGTGGGGGSRPARLRLFLFVLNNNSNSNQSSFSADGDSSKPNQQWFVDALNSVPSIQSSSPLSTASNQDFLFGFEKPKLPDPKVEIPLSEPKLPDISDRNDEIQRQIQELQRLQIANQEQQQAMFIRKNEENLNMPGRPFHGDYFMPEKPAPTVVPVPRQMPAGYWQDRNMSAVTGGYSDPVTGVESQMQQNQQQPVYIVPPQAGRYNTPAMNVRQVTGQMGHGGQGYYGVGVQRAVPDVYREQPVYSMGPPPQAAPALQQQQMQPQQVQALPQMTKMMMGETGVPGGGYGTQVAFDSAGRQVYYTAPPPSGVVMPSSYPTAATTVGVDPRQAGALNPDVKVVKPPQGSL